MWRDLPGCCSESSGARRLLLAAGGRDIDSQHRPRRLPAGARQQPFRSPAAGSSSPGEFVATDDHPFSQGTGPQAPPRLAQERAEAVLLA